MRPPREQLCPHLPRGPPRRAPNDRPAGGGDLSPRGSHDAAVSPHNPVNQPRQNPRPATVRAFLMPKAGTT